MIKRYWRFYLAALLALGLGLALLLAWPRGEEAPSGRWLTLQPRPLVQRIGLVGQLQPERTQAIAVPFDGNVERSSVQLGQRVEAGKLLLRMDGSATEVQLREALSALLSARHRQQELQDWEQGAEVARARRALRIASLALNSTQSRLAESQSLFERGIVPRSEVDELRQQLRLQRLDLQAAQSELEMTQTLGGGAYRQIADMELANAEVKHQALVELLARRDIEAPFAGIVVPPPSGPSSGPATVAERGLPQTGSRVSQGEVLFGLASLERLQVIAQVSELDINQLREGMPVEIAGDGFDGLSLSGRVAVVGALALSGESQGGSRFTVTIALDPLNARQRERVRLGMSARLSIVTYQSDRAIVLPPQALRQSGDGLVVDYRAAPGQPAREIAVSTGHSTPEGVEIIGLPDSGEVRLMD